MHYLRHLSLAHPITDAESFEISLLIGADFYWNIVQDQVIRGNGPTAVSSKLGYLLSGPVPVPCKDKSASMMNVLISHNQTNYDLEKFWKLEKIGIDPKETEMSSEMSSNMEKFVETSISKEHGKYVSKLPWKENCPEMLTNQEIVKRRTENLIQRISKDQNMFKMYGNIIADQEVRGFIEKVNTDENTNNRIHYIPHHPVKKDSVTTPIRIVYNCSCKASNKSPSLNECLADYPPLMNELTSILTRFRMEKYAAIADIEKAFLQIELDHKDIDVTRFYWLENPTDPNSKLITYRFRVVLFGAVCSPFLLSATLFKHFKENPSTTSAELQKNLYVDNALTSFRNESELVNFYLKSRQLLSDAGFNLRSWNSNSDKLMDIANKDKTADSDQNVKILGMRWDTKSDNIMFQKLSLTENKNRKVTKREVLSQSSRIFDPLGLISPITVKSKVFMQTLWREHVNWDDILPHKLQDEWKSIAKEIEVATTIEISRKLTANGEETCETSIHIFSDSSQQAYGACAYLVQGNSSNLIMSKNKVAPVKTIPLPRLELMGALVGAHLAKHLQGFMDIQKLYFWCDSQIVLSWMSSSKTLPIFVSNRIKEIKSLVGTSEWRYCPTDYNPADCLTRGLTAEQFRNNKLWADGPSWIVNIELWPTWTRNIAECNTLSIVTNERTNVGN